MSDTCTTPGCRNYGKSRCPGCTLAQDNTCTTAEPLKDTGTTKPAPQTNPDETE
jgi:hypothetical protein